MNQNNKISVITIDGPSGTGKGTLCYKLAKTLQWHALDSGAIYRVLAYAARENNIPFENIDALVAEAVGLDLCFEHNGQLQVLYKGNNIAQGRDAAKDLLKSDPALYTEIEDAVKSVMEAEATAAAEGARKKPPLPSA